MYEIHEKCFKCINFNNLCGDCIGDKNACPEYEEYSPERALKEIVGHYDFKAQRNQFSEEMAEAILAITKMIRYARDIPKYKDCFANFAEEVADVSVMVQQMRLYLGENLIDGIIDEKLKRQLRRIKEEKMTAEMNIKRANECRTHPDSCEDCRLDMLHNGYNKFCFELTEEEAKVALERSEKQ